MKLSRLSHGKKGFIAMAGCGFIILALAVAFFALPFIKSVLPAFSKNQSQTFYGTENLFYIFRYTFLESFFSTLIAVLVGLPAAFFVSRRKFFARKFLLSFSALPLCIPALITALGYIMTFGINGHVNRFLLALGITRSDESVPIQFLYSFLGIVITQGFYNFPIVMSTVGSAWAQLDRRQEEAAMLLGAKKSRIFWSITLVRLRPAIFSACIPVFLFCFFSFMIVLLFGVNGGTTFEVAIFQAGRSTLDFTGCARLALLETASALVLLFLWTLTERRSLKNTGISFAKTELSLPRLEKKEIPFFILFCIVVILFFVLPFASIVFSALKPSLWKKVFLLPSFFTSLLNTVFIALCTASLSTIAALTYSLLTKQSHSGLKSILPMLPMSVSSVVLAIGFTQAFKKSSWVTLVLLQTALMWPFAYRQIKCYVEKIPKEITESAIMLSSSPLDAVFRVYIPLCRRGIANAFALTLAMSAGDATLPLVLAIPNFTNISLMIYRLAGSYRLSESCVCSVILGALCMILFLLTKKEGRNVL